MNLDRLYARPVVCTMTLSLGLSVALASASADASPEQDEAQQVAAVPAPEQAAPEDVSPEDVSPEDMSPEDESPEDPALVESLSAAQWYERGVELGSEGEYKLAADAFLRSYQLKPTSEALFNAGVAHENAGDSVAAMRAYRRFLAEPERSESLVPAAERAVAGLAPRVSTLKSVRYSEARPPAQLLVNGERVAIEDFPLVLAPGSIVVVVIDSEGIERSEDYELSPGDSLVLDLRALLPEPKPELEPEPQLPPPMLPAVDQEDLEGRADREQRAKALRWTSFASVGLAGASGIAALTFGLLANDSRRRYEAQTCFEYPEGVCPEGFEIGDPDQARQNYQRRMIGTTVSASISAGFVLVALVTGVTSLELRRAGKASNEKRARLELGPSLDGLLLRF